MIRPMAYFLVVTLFFALTECGSRETLAEVEFERSRFGLEYVPDRSLEGYNEKYHPFFQPVGSTNRKYLFNPDDGLMFGNFPKRPELLGGVDVVVVDTIRRGYEKYDRTVAFTTLYVDPKVIDRSSWETLSRFAKDSYSRPDSANQLLRWLNYGYNIGGNRDTLYVEKTIYALVYTNISALEPEYKRADGRRSVKIGVDDAVYFKDDTEQSPGWLYTGRVSDGVFYYWEGRAEMIGEFGDYERAGVKFKSLYSITESDDVSVSRTVVARKFIDTFYSFNSDSLKLVLADAPGSHPEILYYQKWAECAHYGIVKRGNFIKKNDSTIICPVTVKDDLMKALEIDFNVTDTFHVVIKDQRIRSVRTSSNDVDEYYKAKDWVKRSRPQYIDKECEGIWAGGPTPCDCVKGMLKGFGDYVKQK